MEENIREYLKKDLIINNLDAKNEEDILPRAFNVLYNKNYVIERKKVFPIGLSVGNKKI